MRDEKRTLKISRSKHELLAHLVPSPNFKPGFAELICEVFTGNPLEIGNLFSQLETLRECH